MAAIAGRGGSVVFATGYVANSFNWSVEQVQEVADITGFTQAGVRAFLSTVTMWTGQYEAYADDTTVVVLPTNDAAASAVFTDGAGGETWTGNIIITNVAKSVAFDGAPSLVFSFQGTGVLTPAQI